MGAAESKNVQKKAEVGSPLFGPGSAREDATQLAPAVPEDDPTKRSGGLKRRTDGSLPSRRGIKRRRLSRELSAMEDTDERQAGDQILLDPGAGGMISASPSCGAPLATLHGLREDVSGEFASETSGQTKSQPGPPAQRPSATSHDGNSQLRSTAMPDLDSQLAEVSTELREALVSLRESEDSMDGWKDAPAPTIPETQRQTNQLIVRRVMESLRGVHLTPSLSAASLQKSTTTVADYALPGEVKHFFENVETRLVTTVLPSEPKCQALEDGNGEELRSAKRRRLDEQVGSARQRKRRRRSTHTDPYPLRSTGRLRKLTGLWKRDGWRNILKG